MSDTDIAGGQPETRNEPHEPVSRLDVDEFALTAEDAQDLKAQAAVFRAAVDAAAGGQPRWRAETLARAVALEAIAAQATETSDVLKRGNGGEVVLRIPIDAPWSMQEVSRATRDAPNLLSANATVARLSLARDANSLA